MWPKNQLPLEPISLKPLFEQIIRNTAIITRLPDEELKYQYLHRVAAKSERHAEKQAVCYAVCILPPINTAQLSIYGRIVSRGRCNNPDRSRPLLRCGSGIRVVRLMLWPFLFLFSPNTALYRNFGNYSTPAWEGSGVDALNVLDQSIYAPWS